MNRTTYGRSQNMSAMLLLVNKDNVMVHESYIRELMAKIGKNEKEIDLLVKDISKSKKAYSFPNHF